MEWKLELVSVPVTDVDRAKEFGVTIWPERGGLDGPHPEVYTTEPAFAYRVPRGAT